MSLAEIGHNNPPSAIDLARDAFVALSNFLKNTPVIETEETAREAKLFLDRAKATQGDLEAARKAEADPLYAAWKGVNERFKPATEHLSRVTDELKARLTAFIRAEEAKRQREAEEKRRAAEEAERAAREAEAAEREARENASMGEIGVDVGEAIQQADDAFDDAQRMAREAARAERDANVRIGGGFGRVASLRTKETLVVVDAAKAIKAIGLTDKIKDAILSSARDYRKLKGELPKGIIAETERAL